MVTSIFLTLIEILHIN